jgi:Raf kinase inhibitor-like YbhB/YbcL family protein
MKVIAKAATALLIAGCGAVHAQTFKLDSDDIGPDKPFTDPFIFAGLGCKGANLSPELHWSDPPAGTRSFVLMVHDPDAKTGGAGIWHWVVVDIPATARSIEQGAGTRDGAKLPAGSRPIGNDYAGFGISPGYGGPCPPKSEAAHRYHFVLYALGVDKLEVPPAATASQVGFVTNFKALGKAEMVVPYGR